MEKKSKHYLIIGTVSLLVAIGTYLISTREIVQINIVRQMVLITPNFFFAIGIPFLLIGLFRLIKKSYHELRIFYYIIFGLLVGMIIYEYLSSSEVRMINGVYHIIAACIGFFVDMIIYDRFEKNDLRKYKVE